MSPTTDAELTTPTRSFVLGLADSRGHLDTGLLYDAALAAGFTTTKLRLGLRRMIEAGLVTSVGRGRQAEIQLTAAGLADRSPDLAWTGAAYRSDAGLDPWDGMWHLAAFEIPESERPARDALRGQIIALFGGQLSGGLYLSSFPWEPWLEATARAHGVEDRLTTFETRSMHHRGTVDGREIAAAVWPIAAVHDAYVDFVERWEPLIGSVPESGPLAVRAAFEAAAGFENVFRRDPLLPAPLVPDRFAGPKARRLFLNLLEALGAYEEVAKANLFGAYRDAIDEALRSDQNDFWTGVYRATSTPSAAEG